MIVGGDQARDLPEARGSFLEAALKAKRAAAPAWAEPRGESAVGRSQARRWLGRAPAILASRVARPDDG